MRDSENKVGYCRHLRDWLALNPNSKSVRYHEVIPAQRNELSVPPITIDPQTHSYFSVQEFISPPGFVLSLDGAVVYPKSKIVQTSDGFIIPELTDNPDGNELKAGWRPEVRCGAKAPKVIPKTVAVLLVTPRSYYDWLVIVTSKLYLLIKGGYWNKVDYFLVTQPVYSYQWEIFRKFGIETKIITDNAYSLIKAKRLLLTPTSLEISKWFCKVLRKTLSSFRLGQTKGSSPHSGRIYISREDTELRRIINEDEVVSFLKAFGFKKITLSSLDVATQVSIFKHAEIIAGAHGSGFTNIASCPRGTKIVELFSPEYIHSMFWEMANYLGFDYGYLLGQLDERSSFQLNIPKWQKDVILNTEQLERLLDCMGVNKV